MKSIRESAAASRRPLRPRHAVLLVATFVLIGVFAACSDGTSVPVGYDRIGAVGGDVLYAKVARESDGDYADVLVRTKDGDTLCDARGGLMTASERMPALCEDGSPDAFVYVSQTPKNQPDPQLCRQDSGEQVAATRLRTDETWAADFIVLVDRSGDMAASMSPCDLLFSDG